MSPAATATRIRVGLYVRLEAKPGQEASVAEFLKSALPIVEREPATLTWYALRLGPTSFGIYDTFPDDQGRGHGTARKGRHARSSGGVSWTTARGTP